MGTARRIRTLLHDDQPVESTELDLLHTPSMQRLYDLKQLGLADRVFVDATHCRLQHVIGVMEQIDRLVRTIADNLETRRQRVLEYRSPDGSIVRIPSDEFANRVRPRRRAARLMAMLHDVTHAPYGHTLEDEIELEFQKHDDPERQADTFYRLLCEYIGWLASDEGLLPEHEPDLNIHAIGTAADQVDPRLSLTRFLDSPALADLPATPAFVAYVSELASTFLQNQSDIRAMSRAPGPDDLAQMFRDLRFAMRALLWLDALHKDDLDDLVPTPGRQPKIGPSGAYLFEQLIDRALTLAGQPLLSQEDQFYLQRDAYLLDVLGNTICADLLDYAKRDCRFAGLKLDYDVDRITENFTLVSYRKPRDPADKKRTAYRDLEPMLRTAISVFSHKLRVDMPGELMNLLQVRFYVYQRVLFHPTKCVAGAMLGTALQLVGWRRIPRHFRFVGDNVFLELVAQCARLLRGLITSHLPADLNSQLRTVAPVLAGILDQLPTSAAVLATRDLIQARADHRLVDILGDLHAALHIIGRLLARRYYRSIFRLLPSVEIPSLTIEPAGIAEFFRNAERRSRVEREVEQRSSLPKGSVTIHCPDADGPRKIAEILILSEKGDSVRIYPLRRLGDINRKIFLRHQEAIVALEEMYRSMWRLQVSIAPPHLDEYARINSRIGRVLYAALSGEDYGRIYGSRTEEELDADPKLRRVPNDPLMEEELQRIVSEDVDQALRRVSVLYEDGRREQRTERFMEVSDVALRLFGPEMRSYVDGGRLAAQGREEPSPEQWLRQRIAPNPLADDVQLDGALSKPNQGSPAQPTLFDDDDTGDSPPPAAQETR